MNPEAPPLSRATPIFRFGAFRTTPKFELWEGLAVLPNICGVRCLNPVNPPLSGVVLNFRFGNAAAEPLLDPLLMAGLKRLG